MPCSLITFDGILRTPNQIPYQVPTLYSYSLSVENGLLGRATENFINRRSRVTCEAIMIAFFGSSPRTRISLQDIRRFKPTTYKDHEEAR